MRQKASLKFKSTITVEINTKKVDITDRTRNNVKLHKIKGKKAGRLFGISKVSVLDI